jgi:DNA-binding beta-propeller fold protein YncE
VITLAGDGTVGFADGPAPVARFDQPEGIAVDDQGRVFVADDRNHRIRMIWRGQVSTVAGDGVADHQDGPAARARFYWPHGITVDAAGRIYVAESSHWVRMIWQGQVTTVAGDGVAGYQDGPAATARFNKPRDVALSASGDIVYVVEGEGARVRKIEAGIVSTVAGTGTLGFADGPAGSAMFNNSEGLTVDTSGTIYMADSGNYRIRMLAGGTVTTLAGTGTPGCLDGPAINATLDWPHSIAVAPNGTIYVSESWNHRIRAIASGVVSTVAGGSPCGAASGGYADGPVGGALFNAAQGVAVDKLGLIYVTEAQGNRVRVIRPE